MSNPDDTDATIPSTATMLGGCGACILGVCITSGNEIEACDDCARGGTGHASRDGKGNDDAATAFVKEALNAIADVREFLWPEGDPDASWSPDTIDSVARRLAFLAPPRGGRDSAASVDQSNL